MPLYKEGIDGRLYSVSTRANSVSEYLLVPEIDNTRDLKIAIHLEILFCS